jgi:catechol 2,3-dioxygenase-like lactoylglutathione lyase family enzyme
MRQFICCALLGITSTIAQSADKRPKITGIDHVVFYTTAPKANSNFYMDVLGLAASTPPLHPELIQAFNIGSQWIGYSVATKPNSTNRMGHVAFATDNCLALRKYLIQKGIRNPGKITSSRFGFRSFSLADPEGHRIEFVERTKPAKNLSLVYIGGEGLSPISNHMIHVGFIVHDRAAEDHFYRDILGFHIYWHGGMKDNETDWVAMQVPDGTDWVEYMLNVKPNADLHTTGVMNHISLGVKDIKQAQAKLESRGWKPRGDEKTQMGRDGKWQLNLYDPDFTRIELMEFKPVEKPCCSEFQGPHPSGQ